MAPFLLLLAACQAPFGADRQDLVGFRVAALVAAPAGAGDAVVPEVAVVVDGRPWSDDPVALHWHWVEPTEDAVAALALDTPPDATGPRPALVRPSADARLALVAEAPDGTVARAFLDPARTDADWSIGAIAAAALPWDVRKLTEAQLERRRKADTTPADGTDAEGFLRFTLAVDGSAADAVTARWMSTAGTWLELEPAVADWTPGTLVLDGGEIETARAGDDGPVSVVALAVDREGRGAFRVRDVWVGPAPAGVTVAGRWMTGEVPSGRVLATLVADDGSPTGLALADAVPADGATGDALACGDGPFDPGWLLTQVCTRAEVVGARVVLDVP